MSERPPAKQTLCEELLAAGMVMAILDARREGVEVPPDLAADPSLRLNLSWRFGTPMTLDAWGVRATLSFAGTPFPCALPWSAIYVLFSHASGKPYVFAEDVPAEVAATAARDHPATPAAQPALRLVRDQPAAEAEPSEPQEPDPSPPPPRGARLRVVK